MDLFPLLSEWNNQGGIELNIAIVLHTPQLEADMKGGGKEARRPQLRPVYLCSFTLVSPPPSRLTSLLYVQ